MSLSGKIRPQYKALAPKSNAGFTLIELVVVIIVLGILSVVAAPKFINLKSDAHHSVLQGMKGAVSSGNSLVYSKALIQGKETQAVASVDLGASIGSTLLAYGYLPTSLQFLPQDTKSLGPIDRVIFNSITTALNIDATHLTSTDEVVMSEWGIMTHEPDSYISFVPRGLSVDSLCLLEYTGVNAQGDEPMLNVINQGC
ncbi:type II secretion system protein [Shewanella sp. UCD-KL12]|uniref:type II secretion system protein n=1 Tax=Shewanella sp. UCD-KL12 TaxID=1917163 RepID=UPI0009713BEC|nr:prepilin-type N-terminal cleavage/methylation domain-containing protein [Shewanella sp. UCD-KL12]